MDDLKKMIYGKQDYYLDFLSKLVGFDTSVIRHGEDGQEGAAQMYMAGFLERLGCEVDIFEPDNERMKAYPAIIRATAMREGRLWWGHTGEPGEGSP